MGIEEPVMTSTSKKVGIKKNYVFYTGEAQSSIKTNWIMQEYRLSDNGSTSRSSKRRGQPKIVKNYFIYLFILNYSTIFNVKKL